MSLDNYKMPVMKVLRDAVTYLNQMNPETHVTGGMLKKMAADGRVPTIVVGKKVVYNCDAAVAAMYGITLGGDAEWTE